MADYEKKYRLQSAPSSTLDGSGMVMHDTWAIYRLEGSSDPWVTVPGRHKTICVPADELQVVLDMSNGAAKVAAYKQALVDNLDTIPTPVTGWSAAQLEALLDANDAAATEADRANTYITVTLGESYPVDFSV